MTNSEPASERLLRAQELLEQTTRDVATLGEFLTWLEGAIDRVNELQDYYQGAGQDDTDAVLERTPQAVTPPVANEDAVWEVTLEFDRHMMRMLRIATAQITVGLDSGMC